MSDRRDASGSSAESSPEPPSSQSGGRAEESERGGGESWLDRLRAVVGLKPANIREELEDVLEDEDLAAGFSSEERMLLQNILDLREVRVEDIMVPRAAIDAVDVETTLGELIIEFRDCGHSRMPVYRESLDDPLGMVHIKDVMAYVTRAAESRRPKGDGDGTDITLDLARVDLTVTLEQTGLTRSVLFVPPSMPVSTLLPTMQSSRMQMALVIDEYGGTDGLVSIEDAVETVVGEIEDEHDIDEEPLVVAEGNGVFVIDGRAELEDLTEVLGPALAESDHGEDVDTIGGLVFSLFGHIPSPGEAVIGPDGYRFEVLEADPRRIKRVRVFQPEAAALAAEEASQPRAAASGA